MKAVYTVNEKVHIEVDGEDTTELFEGLASCMEVFSTISEPCGLCKKNNTKPVIRRVDKSIYHEIRCQDCGGVLAIGVNEKGGGMYPKRKLFKATGIPATVDQKGKPEEFDYSTRGWHKYNKERVEAGKANTENKRR